MSLRHVRVREVKSLAELERAYDVAGAHLRPALHHLEWRFDALRDAHHHGSDLQLVAEVDDELVGAAIALPSGPQEVTLRLVGVSARHRGKGIGRLLVEALVEAASLRGARRISMHTTPALVPFLEACGFQLRERGVHPVLERRLAASA